MSIAARRGAVPDRRRTLHSLAFQAARLNVSCASAHRADAFTLRSLKHNIVGSSDRHLPAGPVRSEREFPGMDLNSLKYAKSHEWISVQGQTATVGITDFAVKQLTDLVHIELPRKGRTIRQGETFGEVESVKAVSDLYAPATGEIVEVNEALADDLGVLSDDPFGKGWMMKLNLSDPSSLSGLMDRAAYEAHCADESEHA
jgi:glycine cleavage system H protein